MINQTIFRIKKGANLSRCKEVNGTLISDNIKAPKTLYLTKKHRDGDDLFTFHPSRAKTVALPMICLLPMYFPHVS